MILDHNHMALNSHYEAVDAVKIRATAIVKAARRSPALVAGMYTAYPHLVHEIPLEQVAQVAEDLCDAGFQSVVADMSENRAIRKEYREVLEAVALGELVVI
jgi:heme oxygenase